MTVQGPKQLYSFSEHQARQPGAPPPGDRIDEQFAEHARSITEVAQTVSRAFSADGQLIAKTPSVRSVEDDNSTRSAEGSAAEAGLYAEMSAAWAEHMPDIIPPNLLVGTAVTGDHWSSRWWANKAAGLVGAYGGLYLGAWPHGPSPGEVPTIPGGVTAPNPLVVGNLIFNTTTNTMQVWDGAQWREFYTPTAAVLFHYTYKATASQTEFFGPDLYGETLTLDPFGLDNVEVNVATPTGTFLQFPDDPGPPAVAGQFYVDGTNQKIVMHTGVAVNNLVHIDVHLSPFKMQPGGVTIYKCADIDIIPETGGSGNVDGVKKAFNVYYIDPTSLGYFPVSAQTANEMQVSIDGVIQEPGVEYTMSGYVITFTTPPLPGSRRFILWMKPGGAGAGLGGVYTLASEAEAIAGTSNGTLMTPFTTASAMDAETAVDLSPGGQIRTVIDAGDAATLTSAQAYAVHKTGDAMTGSLFINGGEFSVSRLGALNTGFMFLGNSGNAYLGWDGTQYSVGWSLGNVPIWHAGNFTPGNYMPMTGGSITGNLGVGGNFLASGIAVDGSGVSDVLQLGSAASTIEGSIYATPGIQTMWFRAGTGTPLDKPMKLETDGKLTVNGPLILSGFAPTNANEAVSKSYVDSFNATSSQIQAKSLFLTGHASADVINFNGGDVASNYGADIWTFTTTTGGPGLYLRAGDGIAAGSHPIILTADGVTRFPGVVICHFDPAATGPEATLQATTKEYVDSVVPAALATTLQSLQARIEALTARVSALEHGHHP